MVGQLVKSFRDLHYLRLAQPDAAHRQTRTAKRPRSMGVDQSSVVAVMDADDDSIGCVHHVLATNLPDDYVNLCCFRCQGNNHPVVRLTWPTTVTG
jgi:hypothetical protein